MGVTEMALFCFDLVGLRFGLHTGKTGTLSLEPHFLSNFALVILKTRGLKSYFSGLALN
jgi:hypothetical protein